MVENRDERTVESMADEFDVFADTSKPAATGGSGATPPPQEAAAPQKAAQPAPQKRKFHHGRGAKGFGIITAPFSCISEITLSISRSEKSMIPALT